MAKVSKKAQDERIKKELDKLNDILKEIPEDKKKAAQGLIERVAFMTVTLEILEDDIKTNGPTYMFEQGVQKMKVENPAQKSYNTMINRYTAAYDKLLNLFPKEPAEPQEKDDGFETFMMER